MEDSANCNERSSMTLEARALVWLAVQACEVHNGSFAESVTQFVPNLGACNMQSNFSSHHSHPMCMDQGSALFGDFGGRIEPVLCSWDRRSLS